MASTKTKKPSPTLAEQVMGAIKSLPKGKATMATIVEQMPKCSRDVVSVILGRLIRSGHVERDDSKNPPTYRALKKYEPIGSGRSSTARLGYAEVLDGIETDALREFIKGLTKQEKAVFTKRIRVEGPPATLQSLAEELGVSHTTVSGIQKRLLETLQGMKK